MPIDDIKGLRADQVLTSEAFELPSAQSGNAGDKLLRFKQLFLKSKLSSREKVEFKKLKHEISQFQDYGEMIEDRQTERELLNELREIHKMLRTT